MKRGKVERNKKGKKMKKKRREEKRRGRGSGYGEDRQRVEMCRSIRNKSNLTFEYTDLCTSMCTDIVMEVLTLVRYFNRTAAFPAPK